MTTTASASIWDTFEHTPSPRQRAFMRYLTATLVDLVVLGLFAEYWEHVVRRLVHDHAARRRAVAGPPEAHHRRGA